MLSNVFTLNDGKFVNGLSEYQSEEYCQPKKECVNHPHKIFDTYINKELVDEWQEECDGGQFGCVCLDILVNEWQELEDPTKVYKKKGYYDVLKELVHSNIVSGTFYHGIDYYHDLEIGTLIDYSSRMTSWCLDQDKVEPFLNDDKIILKLTVGHMRGLSLEGRNYGNGKEIMLGECLLKVTNKTKVNDYNIFEVELL